MAHTTKNAPKPSMDTGGNGSSNISTGRLPLALSRQTTQSSATLLNQLLADTTTLRDLYKKSHWQVAGHTFYQLHLLFDKHYNEQNELVDEIAERIRILNSVPVAMGADVAELTAIPRPPIGREAPSDQITRLLHAHEVLLRFARSAAKETSQGDDYGTNDLIVSSIIRTNELQVWFIGEHLVDPVKTQD